MYTCGICGERANIVLKARNLSLCSKCFVEWFEDNVRENIIKWDMVRRGDVVAVATSGGKDSLTTLYLMNKMARDFSIRVLGLHVNEGIKGYREFKLKALIDFCRKHDIELHIVSFKEYFGYALDEMIEKARSRGKMVYKPCTICGVFRRYLINLYARKLGATKVATGHNLDDEVQVFIMNIFNNNMMNIAREKAVTGIAFSPKFVPRIKPLYSLYEKEVVMYAYLKGIRTPHVECPYVVYSSRHLIRHMINELEYLNPGFKLKLLEAKEKAQRMLSREYSRYMVVGECKICGEPSSGDICKACQLRSYLSNISV